MIYDLFHIVMFVSLHKTCCIVQECEKIFAHFSYLCYLCAVFNAKDNKR